MCRLSVTVIRLADEEPVEVIHVAWDWFPTTSSEAETKMFSSLQNKKWVLSSQRLRHFGADADTSCWIQCVWSCLRPAASAERSSNLCLQQDSLLFHRQGQTILVPSQQSEAFCLKPAGPRDWVLSNKWVCVRHMLIYLLFNHYFSLFGCECLLGLAKRNI